MSQLAGLVDGSVELPSISTNQVALASIGVTAFLAIGGWVRDGRRARRERADRVGDWQRQIRAEAHAEALASVGVVWDSMWHPVDQELRRDQTNQPDDEVTFSWASGNDKQHDLEPSDERWVRLERARRRVQLLGGYETVMRFEALYDELARFNNLLWRVRFPQDEGPRVAVGELRRFSTRVTDARDKFISRARVEVDP